MKSKNLKDALKKFNASNEGAESRVEILNPSQQMGVKGGLACPCKKHQSVTCQQTYSQGK